MALLKRINSRAAADNNTGFGNNASMYGGRLVNRDGRPNIRKTGLNVFERYSWLHSLIEMSRKKFLFLIFVSFLVINLFFAVGYFLIGVEHLGGMEAKTTGEKFIEAYFFSAQTFTTVGYGRINPTGYLASFVAAFEAFSGLLFFALATGLFYARFSRPKAFILYSERALISPYKDGVALMFRLVPDKNNYLTDVETKLTLAIHVDEGGKQVNRFFSLPLELSFVNALNLSWTIVHPIDDKSPLFGFSKDELIKAKAEVMVFVKAFDETYSNSVVSRTSYIGQEIDFGEKFVPMFHRSEDQSTTVLEIDKLNTTVKADISNRMGVQKDAAEQTTSSS